ncbi:MAG: DUF4126 domain-containing protein [Sphingomonas adhaesiva]|uniref:DUF4126 domain-containing protein n=1 Tax=Sphingomonas adhaesiva TaxID=28212 RepID=UPI002FF5ED30
MWRSIVLGAVAGMRAMTPLAVVANAVRSAELGRGGGMLPRLMARPLLSAGALALAAGEMAGDKMASAPDRIVTSGMIARTATGALAGAAAAPRDRRALGAVLGATAAIGAAYATFHLRIIAQRRYGQSATGAIEDALALGGAALAARI